VDRFLKNTQVLNFLKMLLWEQSCSVRTDRQTTDGQTTMTKLKVAYRSSADAPKTNTLTGVF